MTNWNSRSVTDSRFDAPITPPPFFYQDNPFEQATVFNSISAPNSGNNSLRGSPTRTPSVHWPNAFSPNTFDVRAVADKLRSSSKRHKNHWTPSSSAYAASAPVTPRNQTPVNEYQVLSSQVRALQASTSSRTSPTLPHRSQTLFSSTPFPPIDSRFATPDLRATHSAPNSPILSSGSRFGESLPPMSLHHMTSPHSDQMNLPQQKNLRLQGFTSGRGSSSSYSTPSNSNYTEHLSSLSIISHALRGTSEAASVESKLQHIDIDEKVFGHIIEGARNSNVSQDVISSAIRDSVLRWSLTENSENPGSQFMGYTRSFLTQMNQVGTINPHDYQSLVSALYFCLRKKNRKSKKLMQVSIRPTGSPSSSSSSSSSLSPQHHHHKNSAQVNQSLSPSVSAPRNTPQTIHDLALTSPRRFQTKTNESFHKPTNSSFGSLNSFQEAKNKPFGLTSSTTRRKQLKWVDPTRVKKHIDNTHTNSLSSKLHNRNLQRTTMPGIKQESDSSCKTNGSPQKILSEGWGQLSLTSQHMSPDPMDDENTLLSLPPPAAHNIDQF